MSEYDIDSKIINDLVAKQPAPFTVKDIDLSVAGTMTIREPGYGFVMYGYQAGTNIKSSEALISVAINSDGNDPMVVFPCKTGRGFHGVFAWLTLSWTPDFQSPLPRAKFIIFKTPKLPWQGGLEAS